MCRRDPFLRGAWVRTVSLELLESRKNESSTTRMGGEVPEEKPELVVWLVSANVCA